MQNVEFRKLTIEDYEEIINLWKRAGLPYKPKGRDRKEAVKKQMESDPELFLGAFHEGKLVGTVIGSYDFRMKGWINRLAVDPAYRGRGIAKQLVTRMEEILTKRRAAILATLVELPNPASINLFRKLGYTVHDSIVYLTKRESNEV
jgi:ribosomal protein S18 acetylase RimI-like enzyme